MQCLVVLTLLLRATFASNEEPKCKSVGYELIPKQDCTGYYLCAFWIPVEMPNCPPNSVFSTLAHVCVPKGSIYDDCNMEDRLTIPDAGPLTIAEQCKLKGGIIPHLTECQAYYNCSFTYKDVPLLFEQHLQECPYPQLFNTDSGKCDNFENVNCGNRKVFKNGCDYRLNQCPVAHCIPCNIRIPNCEGKTDGIHEHESKLWSQYYIKCYKERTISQGQCAADINGKPQLFHPGEDQCMSLDRIPREHGGMMPNCDKKQDGFLADAFGQCDVYFVCKNGQYLNQVKCAPGEAFDATLEACLPVDKVCGPCGNRNDC